MTEEMQDGREMSASEGNGLLSECFTRVEVVWAL